MSRIRIKALILQEIFNTRKSVEILFDVVLFPLINVILFAFLSQYIGQSSQGIVTKQMLTGVLLWQYMYIVQYSISVGTMWNLWARNLSNMFLAPLRISEYFTAFAITGFVKSLGIFVLSSYMLYALFGFNIIAIGVVPLIIYLVNLWLFAIAIGIFVLGLIFRYGTRFGALSWGFLPILQPLMATLFPRSVLPPMLQIVALMLPPTYIFEAARETLQTGAIPWNLVTIALIGNLLFLAFSGFVFQYLFDKSRETGQFVRNE